MGKKQHCGRPIWNAPHPASERPSVFLSETSALILVVEIGFLRHRSRRRGTRWKEAEEEGKSGEAEKRPAADETDRLRGPFTYDVRRKN